MLSCVLIEASDTSLRVSATDLYIAVAGTISATVQKPGAVAMPARDMFDRVKSMPDALLSFEVGGNGAVTIKAAGSARKYTMKAASADDYPALPSMPDGASTLNLEAATLLRLISKTRASMSTDETRANLSAALFEWDGDVVRMVSTDGHRLSLAEVKVEGRQATASMLIPMKGVLELQRLCEEAVSEGTKDSPATFDIAQDGPNAFFRNAGYTFSVKLVDSTFPPYRQVIPRNQTNTATVPRGALLDAVRAVSLAASEVNGGVKLAFESGTVKVTSASAEKGEGSDEVTCELTGKPVRIAFDAKYAADAIASIDSENVTVSLGGELDPAVVQDDPPNGLTIVCMPIRQ